ncbi:F-box domain-containing protein [Mycena sanguinolenta]|uniref:F-box domain-containing protein n=1 Tax=Mycena sanguinolenta TaxID=230812 RepID=A0A8H6Z549_9AGAR|nr:F-box domain-containing protein [Mycena sanguinolenta]
MLLNSECQPLPVRSFLLLPLSKHTNMHSFSQILTFIKAYFGAFLSRLLVLWYGENKTDVGDLPSLASQGPDKDFTDSTAEPEPKPEDNMDSGEDLLRAAVDLDLDALPSLPSLFKFPEPRPPVDMPASAPCKQDFGAPSNLYYDRRPFGDMTNFKQFEQAKGMKLNTEVRPLKSAARGRRKTTRLAPVTQRPLVQDPAPPVVKFSGSTQPAFVKVAVSTESTIQPSTTTRPSLPATPSIPIVKLAPSAQPATAAPCINSPGSAASIPVIKLAPSTQPATVVSSPGSAEWNASKAAALTEARNWNAQVRRHSLPIPVPAPAWRRHSAPPALARPPRSNLADRLSALFKEAKDTIDALNAEKGAEDAPTFSAVALEEGRGQEFFIIGEDDDDESATANPGLVSSISASQSMAALASASTRSLTDLLESYDAVMTGPTWRRILARSDNISRRNDSIV